MIKAQAGDRIRIINSQDARYENGDIFEVLKCGISCIYTTETDEFGYSFLIFHEEYEFYQIVENQPSLSSLDYYQSEVVGNEDDKIITEEKLDLDTLKEAEKLLLQGYSIKLDKNKNVVLS